MLNFVLLINILLKLFYFLITPLNKDSINNTKKMKNKILAIPADAPAIPPNPKIPAIIAITTNIMVQRNILVWF